MSFTLERKKILGKGAYGPVFAGRWNNITVAVKRIQLHDLLTDREESAMKGLHHQNVVKLHAVEEDENFKYLILELGLATVNDYCEGKYDGRRPADSSALYQMADGLSYIHGRGLVHRDISTGNVLFALVGDEVVMKIADFGFCKPASENGSFSMSQGSKGTKRFLAPEMLKVMGVDGERPRGNITSDIFSLGCLFFVFLTKGKHPFSDGSIHTISLNIISNNQFLGSLEKKHDYALPLIKGMIEADPEKRLTLENVKASLKL
ncbi:serine/threonine-protein kinase/endoribonuclease IRE1-like [Daphnia carinata]|uniref:serine/threonine-protein kinase/endoribonuclease IRE1-like n=1 Tax=Daphnia carinata TaxID=120202 RepID=UPI002580035E|nr:serine/threonine-protein kinase/endoribonuclease IRE1-like [Daphnia carinata]